MAENMTCPKGVSITLGEGDNLSITSNPALGHIFCNNLITTNRLWYGTYACTTEYRKSIGRILWAGVLSFGNFQI